MKVKFEFGRVFGEITAKKLIDSIMRTINIRPPEPIIAHGVLYLS